jgi:hypothetical protein
LSSGPTIEVRIIGIDRLRAWLLAAPARFEAALWRATEEGAEIEAAAIREDTPQLTGRLASSIGSVVTHGPDGVDAAIGTSVQYAGFVDRGTRQHGAAHHMFQHGAQASRSEVEGRFNNAVRSVTSSFGNV